MKSTTGPAAYEAWYHAPRGQWIAEREFTLLKSLLRPEAGASLLDVGCGTGYFSRRLSRPGLSVTGIDPDPEALEFAGMQGEAVHYLQGSALELPFPDNAFDYTTAVTSLCFVDDPIAALQEMWRVTRRACVLGLLNRHSLLYRRKKGQGSYSGARWDTPGEVLKTWVPVLAPTPGEIILRSAVFLPQGSLIARWCEQLTPNTLLLGGFLAVGLRK
ncbi:methyltransferase family protein [Thiogranum longum]|uniref:Methyltransferase family protein n=1 Tax=Thiogranum longum TaxID=1537524 RepID=A0A4R1HC15_9GAMM|nr:class I SAM-dependent methyltransferase [Thiogranum longum]TCK17730.1 methyltransferase family protein [Thiogranum longum]